MKTLFESRKVLATETVIPVPDAKIIFTNASYIQYEKILLDKNFRQYLETIMVSKNTKEGNSKNTTTKNKCRIRLFRH